MPHEPAAIRQVVITTYTYACQNWYAANTRPDTWLEALLRIPYCVAVCLAFGRMDLEVFADEFRHSPLIATLLPKIEVRVDEALDANWPDERPVRMEVSILDDLRHRARATPSQRLRVAASFRRFHPGEVCLLGTAVPRAFRRCSAFC